MIFLFKNYKYYLKKILTTTGAVRGSRLKLSRFLNCQSGFVSQVLNGSAHFSLEHSIKISEFLSHTSTERKFFMLLVQKAKADSKDLKNFYSTEISAILDNRAQITDRLELKQNLKEEQSNIYYSQWYYSAIHVLVSISDYESIEKICERLLIKKSILLKALKFLEEC